MPRRKVPELEQSLVDLTQKQFLKLSDAKAVELLRIQTEDKRLRARHALLGITFGTVCHSLRAGPRGLFRSVILLRGRQPQSEARQACIGLTIDYRLLYVVHVIREGDVLRLISARLAEPEERRRYEND